MNLFAVFEHADGTVELATPPLRDTILPGVTRDSILTLAREHEAGKIALGGIAPEGKRFIVSERDITMKEVKEASAKGTLREMFGSGTAAIVSPIEMIGCVAAFERMSEALSADFQAHLLHRYEGEAVKVPVGQDGCGDVARVMLREIVGRQTGEIPSDWSVSV